MMLSVAQSMDGSSSLRSAPSQARIASLSKLPDTMSKLQNKLVNMLMERDQRIFKAAYHFDNLFNSIELAREEVLIFKVMSNFDLTQGDYQQSLGLFDQQLRDVVNEFNESCQEFRDKIVPKIAGNDNVEAIERVLTEIDLKLKMLSKEREKKLINVIKSVDTRDGDFEVLKVSLEDSLKDLPASYKKIFPAKEVHLIEDDNMVKELKKVLDGYKMVTKNSAEIGKKVKYACAAAVLFSLALLIMAPTNPIGIIPVWVVFGTKICALLAGVISVSNVFYKTFKDGAFEDNLKRLKELHVKQLTEEHEKMERSNTSVSSDGKMVTFQNVTITRSKQVVELSDSITQEIFEAKNNMSLVAGVKEKIDGFKKLMNLDFMSYVSKATSSVSGVAEKVKEGIGKVFGSVSKKESLP